MDVRRLLVAECALHVRALILESVRADIILSNDQKRVGRSQKGEREKGESLTVHSRVGPTAWKWIKGRGGMEIQPTTGPQTASKKTLS